MRWSVCWVSLDPPAVRVGLIWLSHTRAVRPGFSTAELPWGGQGDERAPAERRSGDAALRLWPAAVARIAGQIGKANDTAAIDLTPVECHGGRACPLLAGSAQLFGVLLLAATQLRYR